MEFKEIDVGTDYQTSVAMGKMGDDPVFFQTYTECKGMTETICIFKHTLL